MPKMGSAEEREVVYLLERRKWRVLNVSLALDSGRVGRKEVVAFRSIFWDSSVEDVVDTVGAG